MTRNLKKQNLQILSLACIIKMKSLTPVGVVHCGCSLDDSVIQWVWKSWKMSSVKRRTLQQQKDWGWFFLFLLEKSLKRSLRSSKSNASQTSRTCSSQTHTPSMLPLETEKAWVSQFCPCAVSTFEVFLFEIWLNSYDKWMKLYFFSFCFCIQGCVCL